MKVLLDMDGVVVDFISGACRFHNRPNPYTEPLNIDCAMIEKIWGMTNEECFGQMGTDFWANLDPYPYLKRLIGLLYERFGKENVCILSSPIRHDGCISGKLQWLKKHLPDFYEERRYLFGHSKEFLAHPGSLLIDDANYNYKRFIKNGGNAYLVPRKWNPHHAHSDKDQVLMLKNWLDTGVYGDESDSKLTIDVRANCWLRDPAEKWVNL